MFNISEVFVENLWKK